MPRAELPIPGPLPSALDAPPTDVSAKVLALYRRLAEYQSLAERTAQKAEQDRLTTLKSTDRVTAVLAVQRFELTRLMGRILPDLAEAGLGDSMHALELFAKSWDKELSALDVEVIDVTHETLSDDLVSCVQVKSAIPDSDVTVPVVREMLTPLVLVNGRVASPATVITSVPVSDQPDGPPDRDTHHSKGGVSQSRGDRSEPGGRGSAQ